MGPTCEGTNLSDANLQEASLDGAQLVMFEVYGQDSWPTS